MPRQGNLTKEVNNMATRTIRCEIEPQADFTHVKSANGFDYFALAYKGVETGDFVQVRVPNTRSEVNSAFLRNEMVSKLPEDDDR